MLPFGTFNSYHLHSVLRSSSSKSVFIVHIDLASFCETKGTSVALCVKRTVGRKVSFFLHLLIILRLSRKTLVLLELRSKLRARSTWIILPWQSQKPRRRSLCWCFEEALFLHDLYRFVSSNSSVPCHWVILSDLKEPPPLLQLQPWSSILDMTSFTN